MEKKESSLTYLSYGSIMLSAIQTDRLDGRGVGCQILRDKRERIVASERLIFPLWVPPSISA